MIVTICVLGVIMVALPSALNSMTRNSTTSETQAIAFFLAREKMEEMMVTKSVPQGYAAIVNVASTAFSSPFNNYSYTVGTQYKSYNGTTYADSGTDAGYKEVTVTVTGCNATAKLKTVLGNYGE